MVGYVYIRSYPGDAYCYIMRAKVWREAKKELDIALGDCNEAIRLDPTNASVYNCGGPLRQAGVACQSKKPGALAPTGRG